MQAGDISNATPPRALVHLDLVVKKQPEFSKILGLIPVTRERAYYDRMVLNALWLHTSRYAVNLELFDIDASQSDMDVVMEDLERIGTNPFRWASSYRSLNALIDELPYRPEVVGVMDVPERALRYGSKYYERRA